MDIPRKLAVAFLAGPWTPEDAAQRVRRALGLKRPRRWITRLAARMHAATCEETLPPSAERLARMIANDPGFQFAECAGDWNESDPLEIDLLRVPSATMQPQGLPARHWEIPRLASPGGLAAWLETPITRLDWLADCHGHERYRNPGPLSHYRYRWLKKGSGRFRLLECPKPQLKSIQRKILMSILTAIPVHDAAHGFCRGRSIVSYVGPHVGQKVVLHIDLRDFFATVRRSRVQAVFRTAGYPDNVAALLAGLCTNTTSQTALKHIRKHVELSESRRLHDVFGNAHLPQGSPTSPVLANLAVYRLDCRLAGLARKSNVAYTRYADDIIFSGDQRFGSRLTAFRQWALAIAIDEGFTIQHRKIRVMRQGSRQQVAGIVLNRKANIPRRDYEALKALLFNCIRFGPATQNREGHADFRAYLQGRVGFVAMINSARGERLRQLLDQIEW